MNFFDGRCFNKTISNSNKNALKFHLCESKKQSLSLHSSKSSSHCQLKQFVNETFHKIIQKKTDDSQKLMLKIIHLNILNNIKRNKQT